MVKIDSSKLTPFENCNGVNRAFWSMKSAYLDLVEIQEELRGKKDYSTADKVRKVMSTLEDGYSHRLGKIQDKS